MQNLPIRPTFIQRILFYSLFIILLISGLLWLYYFNFMNIESDYGFEYNFSNAEENGIIRPSVTPSVFELKNPNRDIYGKVI